VKTFRRIDEPMIAPTSAVSGSFAAHIFWGRKSIMKGSKTITQMSVRERQDILAAVADALETSAKEAMIEGNPSFAANSENLALTIRGSVYGLANNDLKAAEILLQQAMTLIEQFRFRDPHRPETLTLH
jgi:hypothetical protein